MALRGMLRAARPDGEGDAGLPDDLNLRYPGVFAVGFGLRTGQLSAASLDGSEVAALTVQAGFAADFGAHGAVFINRRRLDDGEGMPGRIRYAEHLAHESTHVRLHAAAGARPFLLAPGDRSVLVKTPLRDDPRPLNGLFQQFVVLSRCRRLFHRMLASDQLRPEECGPAAARRELLAGQAAPTADLLAQRRAALTERGWQVLDEAGVPA
jgi:hypothetical protein